MTEWTASPLQRRNSVRTHDGDVALITELHPLRAEAEDLIERVYVDSFAVRLKAHFPVIVGVLDAHGRVIAAAGCRRASEQPLFLEQYLAAPVDRLLSQAAGVVVDRAKIGEIGSLATTGRGASALFVALAAYLHEIGAVYAVATATRRLRRAFSAFGFASGELGPARPDLLPYRGRDWGRYFDHDPVVVWGRVTTGLRNVGWEAKR